MASNEPQAGQAASGAPLRRKIRQCYDILVDKLRQHLGGFMDVLIAKEYMALEDRERVNSKATSQEQARTFIDMLLCMEEEAREAFVEHLAECRPSLADEIRQAPGDAKPHPPGISSDGFLTNFLEGSLREAKGQFVKLAGIRDRLKTATRAAGLSDDFSDFSDMQIQRKTMQLFPRSTLKGVKSKRKQKSEQKEFGNLQMILTVQTTATCSDPPDATWLEPAGDDRQSRSTHPVNEWSVDEVCTWLSSIDGIKEEIVESFREEEISGKILKPDEQLLREVHPGMKVGQKRLIMEQLEQLFKTERDVQKTMGQNQSQHETIRETFRKFDTQADHSWKYKRHRVFPPADTRPGNLLDPIHYYVPLSTSGDGDDRLERFLKETLKFAAACLNERSNGTIHFGVGDNCSDHNTEGEILGLEVDQTRWKHALDDCIKHGFQQGKLNSATHCIRPPDFIEVMQEGGSRRLHVVEVDVVPSSKMCVGEIYAVKLPKGLTSFSGRFDTYRWQEGIPSPLPTDVNSIQSYMELQRKLDERRTLKEKEVSTSLQPHKTPHTRKTLQNKLVQLLCSGEGNLNGNIYPVLVVNSPSEHMKRCWMKKNLTFLKKVPWRVVFDFGDGSESSVFKYLEEDEEQVTRVLISEHFDPRSPDNTANADQLKNRLESLKTSAHVPWVFVNGCSDLPGNKSLDTHAWKRVRAKGYKEAVRFFHTLIPEGRATIMFLTLSQDYDVLIEAADELCTQFQDQWFIVGENDLVTKSLQSELEDRSIVKSQQELAEKSVIGIPFSHVNDTILQVLECVDDTECVIAASTGIIRLRDKVKNGLVDLEILGCNQGDSSDIINDHERLQEFGRSVEEKFYMGEQVDWWNFWFDSHVLRRHCHQTLMDEVSDVLKGSIPDDERVGRVVLGHQPGAGGTTTARQILWDLRKSYRCAVVTNLTDQTCEHISRLHMYEDPEQPLPLLLLLDNYDDERVSDLKAQLEEQCRLTARRMDNAPPVFYTFLVCRRAGIDTCEKMESRHTVLKHDLKPQELSWFRDTYERLEKNFNELQLKVGNASNAIPPRLLISFNILKENFNTEYIQRTVRELTREIKIPAERNLLKYVALLNTYDLKFQSLPAAAFDIIMSTILPPRKLYRAGQRPRWENHISSALRVLLNETSRPGSRQKQGVRIINNLLSKVILEHLQEQSETGQKLSDIMKEFLECGIFNSQYPDSAVEQLFQVVRDLMKKRARKPDGQYETKFSPMVQVIVDDKDQGVSDAASVLTMVFELTDDVFVAQQLARLYISAANWKEATKYAKIITNKKPTSSFLWDTYGNVFKGQVVAQYHECIKEEGTVSPEDAVYVIDLALHGLEIFRKEQSVSQEDTAAINDAGFFGEIEIAVRLLDYLTYVDGLQESQELHNFLVDCNYVPCKLECLGSERIAQFKSLQQHLLRAMRHLDDEYLHLRDEVSDHFRRTINQFQNSRLIRLKEDIENYLGEESNTLPPNLSEEEECKYRRRRVLRLGGSTFRSIFDLKKSQQDGKYYLEMIQGLIDQNLKSLFRDSFDLQTRMSVSIALCGLSPRDAAQISQPEIAEMSKDLYDRENRNPNALEVYLFACMFNWPRANLGLQFAVPANKIPAIVKEWKAAYYKKYPRQREEGRKKKETTMFFLANGEGMEAFAHQNQPEFRDLHARRDTIWRSKVGLQRLQRMKGTLLERGLEISTVLEEKGNKTTTIGIPTSFPITNNGMWNKHVYFVVGFTWSGPMAYDVDVENPKLAMPVQHRRRISPRPTFHAHLSSSHIRFREERRHIQDKLDEINAIRERKARRAKLSKAELKLLREETNLRERLAVLITTHRQATGVFSLEMCLRTDQSID